MPARGTRRVARLNTHFLDAVKSADLDECKRLISEGANVNATCRDTGSTALMVSTAWGHFDMVSFLLKKGASPLIRDKKGCTPAHVAAACGKKDILRVLLECLDVDLLVNAQLDAEIEHDDHAEYFDSWLHEHEKLLPEMLELFFDNSKDIQWWKGSTPLHIASQLSYSDCVKLLIEKGADVTISNSRGLTPLDVAGEIVYRSGKSSNNKRSTRRVISLIDNQCRPGFHRESAVEEEDYDDDDNDDDDNDDEDDDDDDDTDDYDDEDDDGEENVIRIKKFKVNNDKDGTSLSDSKNNYHPNVTITDRSLNPEENVVGEIKRTSKISLNKKKAKLKRSNTDEENPHIKRKSKKWQDVILIQKDGSGEISMIEHDCKLLFSSSDTEDQTEDEASLLPRGSKKRKKIRQKITVKNEEQNGHSETEDKTNDPMNLASEKQQNSTDEDFEYNVVHDGASNICETSFKFIRDEDKFKIERKCSIQGDLGIGDQNKIFNNSYMVGLLNSNQMDSELMNIYQQALNEKGSINDNSSQLTTIKSTGHRVKINKTKKKPPKMNNRKIKQIFFGGKKNLSGHEGVTIVNKNILRELGFKSSGEEDDKKGGGDLEKDREIILKEIKNILNNNTAEAEE